MQEFVNSGGNTITQNAPIFEKSISTVPKQVEDNTPLTAKERMLKRKEEERQKKFEEAK